MSLLGIPLMHINDGDNLPVAHRPPVLSSESEAEYEVLRAAFFDEVRPSNIFERTYLNEYVDLCWERERLVRAKQAIIDSIRTVALRNVLTFGKGEIFGDQTEEKALAMAWSKDPVKREEVLRRLKERNLDESTIEGEAIRLRLAELQILEKLIAGVEARRDKALCKVADLREFFASRLCSAAQTLLPSSSEAVPVAQCEPQHEAVMEANGDEEATRSIDPYAVAAE